MLTLEQAAGEIEAESHRLQLIIDRQEPLYDLAKCREHLVALQRTTPEARFRERLKWCDQFNDHGEPISTCNPDGKWDWYVVGGRWDGWIHDRDTTGERIDDNIATTLEVVERQKWPHAIVTPDGEWHERGCLGWWGLLLTEDENWDNQARALFAAHGDCRVLILDAHV